jgi:ribosome-associated protein
MESILDAQELARFAATTLEDKKGGDILVLELGAATPIADYFVICSANSDRQAKALADAVREKIKETYQRLPFSIEGKSNSGWVLLDYGNVVVHVFLEEERRYYNLEGLWNQATVLLNIQ